MDRLELRQGAALLALVCACRAPSSEPSSGSLSTTTSAAVAAPAPPEEPAAPQAAAPEAAPAPEETCEVPREATPAGYRAFVQGALTPATFGERELKYVYPVPIPATRLRVQTWADRPFAQPAALARDPSLVHLVTRDLPAISADGEVVVEAIHNTSGRVVLGGLELAFFDARSGALLGMLAVPEGVDPPFRQPAQPRPCAVLREVNRLLAAGDLQPLSRILHADFPHWGEPGRDPRWRDVWSTPPAGSLRERRASPGPGEVVVSAKASLVGSKIAITIERGPLRERLSLVARPWTETDVYADREGRIALAWSRFDVRGCGECNREDDLRVLPLAAEP